MNINETRLYAKEWLNRGLSLNKELKQLTDYRETLLKELGGGVASYTPKEIQADNVSAQRKADDLRLNYSETCEKIEKRYAEFARINNETLDVIAKLTDATQRAILTGRHVNFKPWAAVIADIRYSRSNANVIYKKALYNVFIVLYDDDALFKNYIDQKETARIDIY